jgi:hypothetical protein
MLRLLMNKKLFLVASLLLNFCCYTSEEIRIIRVPKEVYYNHNDSFEKYVFGLQSKLQLGRTTGTVEWGAWAQGYDKFVISTCIPASYPLFEREENDIKRLIKNVGSDDNLPHVNLLLDKCSKRAQDKNFIARTTYEEGKRLEQEREKQGLKVSEEDKDMFVVAGLFVRYWLEHKHPL